MGLFNSIIADLPCIHRNETESGEIQIKWQVPDKRTGDAFYLGDTLDGIMPEYDNVWIKKDFVCEVCSTRTKARNGTSFIKAMNIDDYASDLI